jgi:hypothetical protein
MRKLALFLGLVLGWAFGCSQKEEVKDVHTVTTPNGTTEVRRTTEIKKTGDHKNHIVHTAACTCLKDPDGSCKCTKAGDICECQK